jgi:hypothetical protein
MSSNLPARLTETFQPSRRLSQAGHAVETTENEILRHDLETTVKEAMEAADVQAVADATRSALEHELELLYFGLEKANKSAAGKELVATRVAMLSDLNSRRLLRRFSE